MNQKINYLLRSIRNFNQPKKCPNCGGSTFKVIDRKYIFTSLLKCNNCLLNHRHPKDDPKWLAKFYQNEFHIETHIMTKLPSDEELEELISNGFSNLKDYDPYFRALKVEDSKIIDYGCSWGYNVFKLNKTGHDSVGYEVSAPRANFGSTKLNINVFFEHDKLRPENDFVFSSHTIEHLSDIPAFIELSKGLLTEEGYFISFCPNGSNQYREREPSIWHVNWGFLHPNFLDVEFGKYLFKNNPYLILTGDWEFDFEVIRNWDQRSQVSGLEHGGKELLIIARPNMQI